MRVKSKAAAAESRVGILFEAVQSSTCCELLDLATLSSRLSRKLHMEQCDSGGSESWCLDAVGKACMSGGELVTASEEGALVRHHREASAPSS